MSSVLKKYVASLIVYTLTTITLSSADKCIAESQVGLKNPITEQLCKITGTAQKNTGSQNVHALDPLSKETQTLIDKLSPTLPKGLTPAEIAHNFEDRVTPLLHPEDKKKPGHRAPFLFLKDHMMNKPNPSEGTKKEMKAFRENDLELRKKNRMSDAAQQEKSVGGAQNALNDLFPCYAVGTTAENAQIITKNINTLVTLYDTHKDNTALNDTFKSHVVPLYDTHLALHDEITYCRPGLRNRTQIALLNILAAFAREKEDQEAVARAIETSLAATSTPRTTSKSVPTPPKTVPASASSQSKTGPAASSIPQPAATQEEETQLQEALTANLESVPTKTPNKSLLNTDPSAPRTKHQHEQQPNPAPQQKESALNASNYSTFSSDGSSGVETTALAAGVVALTALLASGGYWLWKKYFSEIEKTKSTREFSHTHPAMLYATA